MTKRVHFDNGPQGAGLTFTAPSDVIRADTLDEVVPALREMEQAQANGHWLAGVASYELGYSFSHKLRELMPPNRDVPLLQFGVFEPPQNGKQIMRGEATLSTPVPAWSFTDYVTAFDRVKHYISAGDIYQANLTFALHCKRTGSLDALYAALQAKQSVPHGALVNLGGAALLSRSPELFFSIDAKRNLKVRPMKGTAPRGATPREDAALVTWLQTSEKNRAENLMIVDLLRNDMSRISEIGSVKVPSLFAIETYATLHQMTSSIRSSLREGTSLTDIFAALFPCGSITGAPKIRAMQLIHELEKAPRGAYCGAIGWIAPNGAMSFNVAIRTLTCFDNGDVRLNVGGGVVYDSDAAGEYHEALLKGKYAVLLSAKRREGNAC
ncbi:aminodeoxychorismate synthase, component I [Rhodobacterales bacterium 52_120_T64]|mgnify:CR=1 FL=1|nr:aminodeoxychorismate synthase, component I [Rhodobacterales bacterium 52_120_T64]